MTSGLPGGFLRAVGDGRIEQVEPQPRALEPDGDARSAPGSDRLDLADLLRRSARGDEAAFAELYDATSPRIYGLALRVVRDPAQAQEVTQEAYLETWRTASRFDPAKGSAISWLMTIAHRKGVDRVRSAEASGRRDTTYHEANATVDHDSTADAAEASLEARRVRAALSGLTVVQREAITLAYSGGYTHTEVATMLDLPVGTAKTRIRDGLIRLRDALGVGGERHE
jgi:RNA polymerase sigma-70 factor (ECF subfamily)